VISRTEQAERGLRVERVGLSMFVLDTPDGTRLLTDPWIGGNPTLVRDRVTSELFASLDGVLVSHGHTDHAEGIPAIVEAHPGVEIFTGFELGNLLLRRGHTNVTYINHGGSVRFRDLTIHFVPASHESAYRTIDLAGDRSRAQTEYAGLACGIMLTFDSGYRLYFAGDTGLSAEMTIVRDYWRPDLAILPVGGGVTGMGPDAAAYAAGELLRVPHAIPCHWAPIPEEAPDPDLMQRYVETSRAFAGMAGPRGKEFAALVGERYPAVRVTVLELGQSTTVDVDQPRVRAYTNTRPVTS
jgi:L-ascorbate metabolism protein UlaG (beta-lactamase superfamily)